MYGWSINSSTLHEAAQTLNRHENVNVTPQPSYVEACARFSWRESLDALGWAADGAVNLAETLVERHAGSDRCALRWFGKTGAERTLGFDELARLANRFAGFLASAGVGKGDRVAGFLPRVPETLAVMLGTWKIGAVYVPIFTGFGADAVAFRMRPSGAELLCTHHEYRDRVPELAPGTTVVTIGTRRGTSPRPTFGRAGVGDVDFYDALEGQPDHSVSIACRRDDPAVLLYTSGSTGPPKGVKIATNFVLAIHPYITLGVDLQPDDVFWPTGDPGWGYGLVCYMLALALGVPVVVHEAAPSPEFALSRIVELGVTNLATTPTLLRGIMALGASAVCARPARVRRVSSCGEPLNAEVVNFFRSVWGVTVMDHYGSSEFGLPIGNLNAVDMTVKPGSMGLPLPGCRMAIVDDEGHEVETGTAGHIVMAPSEDGYYSLGYWEDPERTREMFHGPFITSGDLGRRDADGYFWFEGRADDVIKSAGYRIGPFEIESVILEHPAVAEAAVVGKPDALRGHIVKAFVVLRPGAVAGSSFTEEIVELVKTRVGRHQYPREIEVVRELPKTETGKIQRFVLRQRGTERIPMTNRLMITAAGTAWPERYTFSPALRVGNLLFISGTTAVDETGTLVAPGDIVGQTRYIYEKFARLLAATGAGLEHVVETTEYLTTTENYRGTAEVRRAVFTPPYPTATGVIVAGLLREGALIEISAIAVLPE